MEFLNNYISGIVVVSVLAILLENILPETHQKKYINVTIGLLVMLIIIKPITETVNIEQKIVIPETLIDDSDLSYNQKNSLVIEEFQKRLSVKISDEVKAVSGKKTEISVLTEVNENGEITAIKKITAYPLDEEIKEIITKIAGVTEDIVEEEK